MKLLLQIFGLLVLLSCSKVPVKPVIPEPEPSREIRYVDLKDKNVKPGINRLLDVDGDGLRDLNFKVYLVGDPILKRDRYFYSVSSFEHSLLMAAGINESPVFGKGDIIPAKNLPPYEWYLVAEVYLVQKVIEMNRAPYFAGSWLNADHRYLGFQLTKAGKTYSGWIELSFDAANEQLILHKAAVSLKADTAIKAGW